MPNVRLQLLPLLIIKAVVFNLAEKNNYTICRHSQPVEMEKPQP